jgi:tetratricopeptide (TPR) repeat protein
MKLQNQKRAIVGLAWVAVIMLHGTQTAAQVLTPDQPKNRPLILVEEQYQQQHYAMAAQSARQYLTAHRDRVPTILATDIDKAYYYMALSYLKADMPGCVDTAQRLLSTSPNAAYTQRVSFALAQYYFQHDMLNEAIPLYEGAGVANLTNEEVADSKFELAYAYFNNRQFDKAEPLFAAIKELKDGKYYMAGNYYYGLLLYNDNKYEKALQSFNKVKDAKEYRTIVPYYIAEIYYFMGNRTQALALADTLIKRDEKSFYDNELHLLAAQCLFEEQRYKEARPYFEYYYEHTDKIRKEDVYEMAYTYYQINDWQNAIDKFKMLSDAQDSLGQTAMYLLGDCYLKTGDKGSARNAFGICADMSFNKGQQEAAMILYSRLSYEEGNHDDALRGLNTLLTTFPRSKYKDEAKTLISDLLIKTNNYEEALKQLEGVSVKDNDYWMVSQKANFGYAVQEYMDGSLNSADDYFMRSLQNPVNADYEAAAKFWRGELGYKLHRYNDALTFSQQFVSKKGNMAAIGEISPLATLQHAYINMGYAAMEMENFSAAQEYFAQAQNTGGRDNYSASVAALREADAVFLQKNYPRAITLYDKIIASGSADADYARYQKAILLGLENQNNEKVALLQTLIRSTPPSVYANNARYEAGITYLESDKYPQALALFQSLTDSVADKSLAPKAWMKIGYIYQQTKNDANAIEAYKHVVIGYPAAEERMAAMDALRNVYIQSNQPAAYSKLLKDYNLPSSDSSSIDATYYAAAEAQFSNSKWDAARQAFTNYLKQYPNGIFAVKAYYYRGESNYQLKKYKEARDDYNMVLVGEWNDFSENSARHAAAIAYDQKDYTGAYAYYQKLRANPSTPQSAEMALRGLAKAGFNAGKYSEAAAYADSLLALPGISPEASNEALYYKAKSLQHFGKGDEAMVIYQQLSGEKNTEVAAESRYHIAEILLAASKVKEAEEAADAAIRLSGGFDYWNIKSLILMSDIFAQQKDYFNAKATLQSIVKNSKIPELKQEASKKLDEVRKLEKQKSKLSEH